MTQAHNELVFGLHSAEAVLRYQADRIVGIWLDRTRKDPRFQQLLELAEASAIHLQRVSGEELERLAGNARHQGVVLQIRPAEARNERFLEELLTALDTPPFLLILDGVTDPHNLGACLRSADAAGVHAVIAPRDKACGLTPVVRKVASGAAGMVPFIQVTNLARSMRLLRETGVFLVGAAGEAEAPLYATDLRGSLGIVMGAEGKGMRRLTREHCDQLVHIPMAGTVSSLNVSVATGICLFEALRQRSAS